MAAHACNSSFERKMQFQLQEEEAGILRVYIGRLKVKKKRNSSIRLAWLPVSIIIY